MVADHQLKLQEAHFTVFRGFASAYPKGSPPSITENPNPT